MRSGGLSRHIVVRPSRHRFMPRPLSSSHPLIVPGSRSGHDEKAPPGGGEGNERSVGRYRIPHERTEDGAGRDGTDEQATRTPGAETHETDTRDDRQDEGRDDSGKPDETARTPGRGKQAGKGRDERTRRPHETRGRDGLYAIGQELIATGWQLVFLIRRSHISSSISSVAPFIVPTSRSVQPPGFSSRSVPRFLGPFPALSLIPVPASSSHPVILSGHLIRLSLSIVIPCRARPIHGGGTRTEAGRSFFLVRRLPQLIIVRHGIRLSSSWRRPIIVDPTAGVPHHLIRLSSHSPALPPGSSWKRWALASVICEASNGIMASSPGSSSHCHLMRERLARRLVMKRLVHRLAPYTGSSYGEGG